MRQNCLCYEPEDSALSGYRPEESLFDHCGHPECRGRKAENDDLKAKWEEMRWRAAEGERHRKEMELEADAVRDELARRNRMKAIMTDKHREFEEAFNIATTELVSRRREEAKALAELIQIRSNADAAEQVIGEIKACHASESPGCHYCHENLI